MKKLFVLYVLSCFYMTAAFAQETEEESDSAASSSDETRSRPIEEITVIGERSTYAIRMEIEATETEVYGLFNELNSNDEFDVTCTDERFTGSLIPKRVCMSEFLRREQARNAGLSQTSIDVLGNGLDMQLTLEGLRNEVSEKSAAMEAEMLKLISENEQFADAILKLTILMGELEARKKRNPLFFD